MDCGKSGTSGSYGKTQTCGEAGRRDSSTIKTLGQTLRLPGCGEEEVAVMEGRGVGPSNFFPGDTPPC